jgi:shikimate dehydrogenase
MKKLGLIGFPLTHSFSKKYFDEKFIKENISDYSYSLYSLEKVEDFTSLLVNEPELIGLNVTYPYKETIIPFLDELDPVAKAVRAVNTIKIEKSGDLIKLVGYNTDVFGFRQSIKPFLEPQHEKALILGTGGAAKAVEYALWDIGVSSYFVSRDKNRLEVENCFSYEELNPFIIESFKLIVNTTPLGMYPNSNESPEIPYEGISKGHLLYDLIYNPEETLFMKKGKEHGAVTINGYSMLCHQADKAWEIWRND